MSHLTIADDLVVSIDYTLTLDDGQLIDQSENGRPLEYLQGHSNIIPGLEVALYGLKVGDEKKVEVDPIDGYGEISSDNFDTMPRSAFPADLELQEGLGLHLQDSQTGQALVAYISEIRADEVLLDFNHPLAGETLHFQVKVADIREATAEELAHGHVHGEGHAH